MGSKAFTGLHGFLSVLHVFQSLLFLNPASPKYSLNSGVRLDQIFFPCLPYSWTLLRKFAKASLPQQVGRRQDRSPRLPVQLLPGCPAHTWHLDHNKLSPFCTFLFYPGILSSPPLPGIFLLRENFFKSTMLCKSLGTCQTLKNPAIWALPESLTCKP